MNILQVNVSLTAIQLFGWFAESKASVKWWDIVPPELEDESDEYSNSINNCSPTYRDEIDKSGLLDELKDLNENVERAGSNIGNHDSDPLFASSNICVKEFILLLGIVTRHRLTSVALEDILDFINIISPVENGEKMKNSSPKKLLADRWSTVGRLLFTSFYENLLPTVGRLLVACR